MTEQVHTWDFLDEFVADLHKQLEADEQRWGATWLRRPRKGQTARTRPWLNDYFDRFEGGGMPVDWTKAAGGIYINWLREKHPELSPQWEEPDGPSNTAW